MSRIYVRILLLVECLKSYFKAQSRVTARGSAEVDHLALS